MWKKLWLFSGKNPCGSMDGWETRSALVHSSVKEKKLKRLITPLQWRVFTHPKWNFSDETTFAFKFHVADVARKGNCGSACTRNSDGSINSRFDLSSSTVTNATVWLETRNLIARNCVKLAEREMRERSRVPLTAHRAKVRNLLTSTQT